MVVRFFTELDAILDTRLGTLLRINPDITPSLVKTGYFDRDRDQFPNVPVKTFQDLYEKRDKQTLKASMMTPVMDFVRDFIKHSYEMNIETPFLRDPKITVNLHPYVLLPEEQNLIKAALIAKTGAAAEINFVNMTASQITPSWLKQEVNIMAVYNPYDWMELLAKTGVWEKETCPSVMVLAPLRIRDLSLKDINMAELQKELEWLASPFFNLQLLAMRTFSADVFPKQKPSEPSSQSKESA